MNAVESFERVRVLLQNKLDCFLDIKRITEANHFTGIEHEADAYISMVDKREYVLQKVENIDAELKRPEFVQILNTEIYAPDLNKIKSAIHETIREIAILDKRNRLAAEKIKQNITFKIRELKVGKEVSSAYHQDTMLTEVSRFDSKN